MIGTRSGAGKTLRANSQIDDSDKMGQVRD
jgi:hypothetical protein